MILSHFPPMILSLLRRLGLLVLFSFHCFYAQSAEPVFLPDRVIVRPKPGVSEAALAAALKGNRVTESRVLAQKRAIRLLKLAELSEPDAVALAEAEDGRAASNRTKKKLRKEESREQKAERGRRLRVKDAVEILRRSGLVEYAEPDYVSKLNAIPNDPRYGDLYGMTLSNAPAAWDIRTDASSVIVAVVDTGVNYNHPDLKNNVWKNPGEIAGNGIDDDANGFIDDIYGIDTVNGDSDPKDDHDHGSHVSGTIGAEGNNGVGVVGVAWKAKIMAVKAFDSQGSGPNSATIPALDYAIRNGAKVINNSWGGTDYSQAMRDVIEYGRQNDVVIVCAAGNDGENIDNSKQFSACYLSDNVVSVSAINDTNGIPSWSSYGLKSDIFAPGHFILSTLSNNDYGNFSGTSMATPHVAGAVTLLRAQYPSENHAQIINRLHRGAAASSNYSQKALTGGKLDIAASMAAQTRPLNDDIAGRIEIRTAEVALSPSMGGSTVEAGEPLHAGVASAGTVWYRWVPQRTGPALIETKGSRGDTILAVYQGTTFANLSAIAANDDIDGTAQSRVNFSVVNGQNYLVAVSLKAGSDPLQSNVELRMQAPPANDNFSAAEDLGNGYTVTVNGSTVGATLESGEPSTFPIESGTDKLGATIWYRWTAPTTRYCEVDTIGSGFDTVLGVYQGTNVASLTRIAINDDITPGVQRQSRVGFVAQSGQAYYFAIGGWLGHTGSSKLNVLCETQNRLPTGKAVISPVNLAQPLLVRFSVGDVADVDGTVVSYVWNFGNGAPTASGATVDHTYAQSGRYNGTLTLTDNEGGATVVPFEVVLTSTGLDVRAGALGYWRFDRVFGAGAFVYVPNELRGFPTSSSDEGLDTTMQLYGNVNLDLADSVFSAGSARFGQTAGSLAYGQIKSVDANPYQPKTRTFAMWVKLTQFFDTSNTATLVRLDDGFGGKDLLQVKNDKITYTEFGETGSKTITASGFTMNTWHHVACTYDKQRMKIYLNGNVVADQPYVVTGINSERGQVTFGRYPRWIRGWLDEVWQFDRALSLNEVKLLMNQGIKRPTGLSATVGAASTVNLQWTDTSGNEDGFYIQRKLTSSSTFATVAMVASNATSFADTTAPPNKQVDYRVVAYNVATESGPTNTVTLTSPPASAGNLLENPDFETGTTTGWAKVNSSFAVVASPVHGGQWSMQVSGRGANDSRLRQNILATLNYNGAGTYDFSAWVHAPQAGNLVARIAYRDGTTWKYGTANLAGVAGWNLVSGSAALAWTTLNEAYLEVYPSDHALDFFVDDVSLTRQSTGNEPLPPTIITLSNASVAENQPAGTTVGTFTTTDPNSGDTHTYMLSGADAASFTVVGAQLRTAAVFDYETKNTYNIIVRTTDNTGLFFEKAFVINVTDVAEGGGDPTNFAPAADAQVRDSSFANTNFGTTDRMEVKLTSSVRQGFLKFNLANVNASSVTNATLTLVVSNVEAGVTTSAPVGVALHAVANDSWTETGITWNTRPLLGAQIGTANISAAGQVVTFNITSAVNAELAGDKTLSLAIVGASGTKFVAFWTKEGTTAPRLDLTLPPPPSGTPYEQWRNGIAWGTIPVDQRTPENDPDGDGVSNFMERALGGDPTRSDSAPGYSITMAEQGNGSQVLTLWYYKGATDLSYQMQWSYDLATWSSAGVSTEHYHSSSDLHYRTITIPSGGQRVFTRLEVRTP